MAASQNFGQEVTSLFLSLKYPGHDPGALFFIVALFFSWGLAGAEAVVVSIGQVVVLG